MALSTVDSNDMHVGHKHTPSICTTCV